MRSVSDDISTDTLLAGDLEVLDLSARTHSAPTDPEGDHDGLPISRRRWSIVAISFAVGMTVIDTSIANIALPTIALDVHASAASSIWVVNAYQIAIVMTLLPMAALGDRLTYRSVYIIGLGLFVAASLVCSLADGLIGLSVARFVQGLGAAGVMAVNGALVRFTYPKAMLGRGIGLNAMVAAVASALGPTVASVILEFASWRWLFAVNVPLGLISLAIGMRFLPHTATSAQRFDLISAAMSALTFLFFFLACSGLAHGDLSLHTGAEVIVTLVGGTLLILRSRRQAAPLLPLDLVRVPVLRLSYASSIFAFGAQTMVLIALPFYLQRALGFSHLATGLVVTALPVGIAIAAPISGRLVERKPAGLLGGVGLIMLATGFILLAVAPSRNAAFVLAPAMLIAGLGFGFFQTPNNRTMLGHAPAERSGAAAGMQAISRLCGQTGGAIGVACLFRALGPTSVMPMIVAAAAAILASAFSLRRLRV